jgi:phosphoketolase
MEVSSENISCSVRSLYALCGSTGIFCCFSFIVIVIATQVIQIKNPEADWLRHILTLSLNTDVARAI